MSASPLVCPHCQSTDCVKNGRRSQKQAYLCRHCRRQFLESYGDRYSQEVKALCVKMHQRNLSLREIERLTDIDHRTLGTWVKQLTR